MGLFRLAGCIFFKSLFYIHVIYFKRYFANVIKERCEPRLNPMTLCFRDHSSNHEAFAVDFYKLRV